MIKYAWLLLLTFLVGCTATYSPLKKEQSHLNAWAEDESSIYLVSNEPAISVYQFPKAELKPIVNFLQSPIAKKLTYQLVVTEIRPKQGVNISFYQYVVDNDLTDRDKETLLNNQFELNTVPTHSYFRTVPALAKGLESTDILYDKRRTIEKGVLLPQLPDSLQATPFQPPIETDVIYMKRKLSTTPHLVEGVIWAPFMILMAPLVTFHN